MTSTLAIFAINNAEAVNFPLQAQTQSGNPMFLLMIFFGIFYFMVLRPQTKSRKAHAQFIAGLKKGDKVVTEGGVYGTVFKVENDRVTLDVGDRVRVTFVKTSLSGVVAPQSAEKE
jgi:preprotein translocase subunit YajC